MDNQHETRGYYCDLCDDYFISDEEGSAECPECGAVCLAEDEELTIWEEDDEAY
ncbi:MAG: hypothetical protein KDK41_18220 [Leptospiraceae bacterium]|nr:hypothetical protein [Leptospiraceae bacterium]